VASAYVFLFGNVYFAVSRKHLPSYFALSWTRLVECWCYFAINWTRMV